MKDALRTIRKKLLAQWLVGGALPLRSRIYLRGKGVIYVEPDDKRGVYVRACCAVTQPLVTWAWLALGDKLEPTLFIDVGANYGEIGFSRRYTAEQKVIMFEPNPAVARCLRRSVASRPDSSAFTVLEAFLADIDRRLIFTIDKKWSGTSSAYLKVEDAAYKGAGTQITEHHEVHAKRLSDCVPKSLWNGIMLMKIDVEGGEVPVLMGARDLLRAVDEFACIVEVNPRVGDVGDLGQYIDTIRSFGNVAFFKKGADRLSAEERVDPRGMKMDVIVYRGRRAERALQDLRIPRLLRMRG